MTLDVLILAASINTRRVAAAVRLIFFRSSASVNLKMCFVVKKPPETIITIISSNLLYHTWTFVVITLKDALIIEL